MSKSIQIKISELKNYSEKLKIGDKLFLTGYIYTARDAAHKRFLSLIDENKSLPFDICGSVIYYAGPTAAPEGKAIGSCGPTTSSRMDKFAPKLLDLGLVAMIGKGERNNEVISSIVKNKALYLCAVGGAGALASKCIKSCEVIAFEDLGCESVKRLYIEDFPVVVANDSFGGDIFKIGRQTYQKIK